MSDNYRNDQNKDRQNQSNNSQQKYNPQKPQGTPMEKDRQNTPFNKNPRDKNSEK